MATLVVTLFAAWRARRAARALREERLREAEELSPGDREDLRAYGAQKVISYLPWLVIGLVLSAGGGLTILAALFRITNGEGGWEVSVGLAMGVLVCGIGTARFAYAGGGALVTAATLRLLLEADLYEDEDDSVGEPDTSGEADGAATP